MIELLILAIVILAGLTIVEVGFGYVEAPDEDVPHDRRYVE